jgi:hypothetical protein
MICENCRHERNGGSEFRFYYGKKNKSIGFWGKSQQISGDVTVWICNQCLNRYRAIVGVISILIGAAGVLEMIHLAQIGNVVLRMLTFGLMAAVFVVVTAWFIFGTRQEIGERLAIRARKAGLKKQGYNAFLTTMARSRYP